MAEASTSSGANGFADQAATTRQVPVVLRTSEVTLSIPQVPYLIPTTWRRAQLSTLVNRLLQQAGGDGALDDAQAQSLPSVPFDFIIDGELLRTTLSKYLESKGLTEESTVEIEYVRSTLPPKFTAAFEHDDWLSGVDASRSGDLFLTSSYDGTLRVFGSSTIDKPFVNFCPPNLTASLTDVCWLESSGSSSRMATVGMDGMLRVCSVAIPDEPSTVSGTTPATLESASLVKAFETPSPLSSVRAHSNQGDERLLTSGWDGSLAIWRTHADASNDGDDERTSKKRRKGVKGDVSVEVPSMAPLSLLWHVPPVAVGMDRMPGQNARVSAAIWMGGRNAQRATEAVSAGWDGSVRLWDVDEGRSMATKTSDKVILCLDALQAEASRQLVVTGHVDRSAALWDLRTSTASNIAVSFSNAHAGPVHAVRAHPTSANLFATGAADGAVKLWDIRSPRAALFALSRPSPASGEAKKVLALDWDPTGQTVVAGGEDAQLAVFRGEGIGREAANGALSVSS